MPVAKRVLFCHRQIYRLINPCLVRYNGRMTPPPPPLGEGETPRLLPVGSLTVITGSMFSGKTEELIRRVRRALYARRRVQVFKPAVDTRTDHTVIRSHNDVRHEAVAATNSAHLREQVLPSTQVVAIEEAQFFDPAIVEVCQVLANEGLQVIVGGLDMDFRGCPFGPMPALLAVADEVVKLRAICARCGADAARSQRLIDGQPAPASAPIVLIGAQEHYEARCRHCHEVPD
jgi:thymidine kinase